MLLPATSVCNYPDMPRRIKQSRPFWTELAGNFKQRVSDTDLRVRRRVVKCCLWAVGLMFLYTLMGGTYSIPRIIRLEYERRALTEANRQYTAELIDAARIRDLLRTNRSYIEYIARTRYRMVRPDETIYRYRGQ